MKHGSMLIKTNISKHFTQEQMSLCLLQAERSHVVICNDLVKGSVNVLTFLVSVLVRTDAVLIVSTHQSVYKADILTQYITNSIWCQNLMA